MKQIIPIQKKFKSNFRVPGSKSYTNRALLLASLADGESIISNGLESDDTKYMASALKQLGVSIIKQKNKWKVKGRNGNFKTPKKELYMGNAGTAVRFITAALAATNTQATITGSTRMLERPIGNLTNALQQLGAEIIFHQKNGFLPLTIKKGITGGKTKISGNTSSQYLSALLQALPLVQKPCTIKIIGKQTSLPYIKMTLKTMQDFGIKIDHQNYNSFNIRPSAYHATHYKVEADASSATYPLAIAAINQSQITIENLGKNSTQADIQFVKILKKMGCETKITDTSITVKGSKKLKPPGTINLNRLPDAAMTIAILCCFADGISKLTGIGNLRVKETDRLKALTNELNKIGANVIEKKDSLIIHGDPKKLHGNLIKTYGDHRMAMCFAVAGSRITDITILNPECVSKTYPSFWKDINLLGLKQKNVGQKFQKNNNVVLIGLRGSGKTSIGKSLAKKLNYKFIDTDELIEKQTGEKITTIVAKKGWQHFRQLEKQVAREISSQKKCVIATGGGMVIDPINTGRLGKNGIFVLLKCDPASAVKRIKNETNRPKLTTKKNLNDELEQLWNERKKTYNHIANIVIETGSENKNLKNELKKNVSTIIELLKETKIANHLS